VASAVQCRGSGHGQDGRTSAGAALDPPAHSTLAISYSNEPVLPEIGMCQCRSSEKNLRLVHHRSFLSEERRLGGVCQIDGIVSERSAVRSRFAAYVEATISSSGLLKRGLEPNTLHLHASLPVP
jgi:hypothetical protein